MLALRLLLAGALLVAGLVAAGIAWSRADENAQDAQDAAANAITDAAESTADTAIAGLGGGAGLVPPSGQLPLEQFDAFRRDVSSVSSLDTLAYVPIVGAEERAEFEASLGSPILDLNDTGLVVAPERPSYWPVQAISPDEPTTAVLRGIDIQASPISAAAAATARDTGDTVVTEPVELGDDLTVFFIIKPLFRPGLPLENEADRRAAHAGFLASAYSGAALGEGSAAGMSDDVHFSVRDDDVVLAQSEVPPSGSDQVAERQVEVGGQSWTVAVEDDRPVNHDLSWFLLVITLALVGGLLYLVVRGMRYERSLARIGGLVGSTADLAQHLASAATVDEVAEVIDQSVAAVFHANSATLRVLDAHGTGVPSPGSVPDAGPLADAVRTRDLVLVERERGRGGAVLPLESDRGVVIAAVEIDWTDRVEFDEVNVATLRTVAELCEQTLQRAALTDRVASRADQLARLAEALAGATTVAEVSALVTDLGRLPVGASAASIGIIDTAAGVLRVNHGDTVDEDVRDAFANPSLDDRLAFTDAARTGEAVLVPDYAEYERLYPGTDQANRTLGQGARAALPLRDGSRVFGAVVFAWPQARVFDDLLLANLSTIAEMATQSVIRAGLTEEQLLDARHSRELADFAQRVARVTTVDEFSRVVVDGGGAPVGAVTTNIGLVVAAADRLVVLPYPFFDPTMVGERGAQLSDTDLPIVEAIRSNDVVVLPSSVEIGQRFPGRFADGASAAGVAATIHLPLVGTGADPLGAIGFGWSTPQVFDATRLATLHTITELCSQTLERVRLAEAEHDLVSSLQHRVVRPLPSSPGLHIAQRYRPAARAVGMGGDWYEGIALVDGRYALVMGDVAGHGINAVSDMVQIRSVVGALIRSGVSLGDIFSQATGLLDDAATTVTATAGVVLVDPVAESLSYVMAGHLPPVLTTPDGRVRLLEEGRQPLLGLPIMPITAGTAPFPEGSTLTAYTDGLIERRTESIDESMQRLLGVVADLHGSTVEEQADEVLARCLGDEDPADDVALVILRLAGPDRAARSTTP